MEFKYTAQFDALLGKFSATLTAVAADGKETIVETTDYVFKKAEQVEDWARETAQRFRLEQLGEDVKTITHRFHI